MSYRPAGSEPLIGQDVDLVTFRFVLVLGSLLTASFLPSMVYGGILNQWGSNLIWGSVYGIGWCLASSFISSSRIVEGWIGLAWAWTVPVLLYVLSSWSWPRLQPSARRKLLIALLGSFFVCVPASVMLSLSAAGIHLPDFGLHMATSY